MWKNYHNLTKNKLPSFLLVRSLKYAKNKGRSLDLGCGAFRDSKLLLKYFEFVEAMDYTEFKPIPKGVIFTKSTFKDYNFNLYDLINSQFALPFAGKYFPIVWKRICKSLIQDGIFVGQFFGDKDEWKEKKFKTKRGIIFHTQKQVEILLTDFEIIYFKEIKKRKRLISGEMKNWHYFNIIAKLKKVPRNRVARH
jgi:hypothetical protein